MGAAVALRALQAAQVAVAAARHGQQRDARRRGAVGAATALGRADHGHGGGVRRQRAAQAPT